MLFLSVAFWLILLSVSCYVYIDTKNSLPPYLILARIGGAMINTTSIILLSSFILRYSSLLLTVSAHAIEIHAALGKLLFLFSVIHISGWLVTYTLAETFLFSQSNLTGIVLFVLLTSFA